MFTNEKSEMSTEKQVEDKLVKSVKRKKGIAVKFSSPWMTGMPDRIVLLPGGRIFFVELKNENGKLSPRQKVVHGILASLGFKVEVISSLAEVQQFINKIEQ